MNKFIAFALLAVIVLQIVVQVHADYLWIERPGGDLNIQERTDNMTSTNETSVGLGVAASKYFEEPSHTGYYTELNVSMTANSRKAISYAVDSNLMPGWQRNTGYSWVPPWLLDSSTINQTLEHQVGDDFIAPLRSTYNPFLFRFFGGLGSAEYRTIYVSSNGFIGFDNTTQPSPTPSTTLSTGMSNAMIAAVWTDLNITGGDSNIIVGNINGDYTLGKNYFVVIWNNALDKASGQRLSFEIILGDSSYNDGPPFMQSEFWIVYFSVGSTSETWGQGYRDQEGYKGDLGLLSGDSLGWYNGTVQHYYQDGDDYVLSKLTLSYRDTYSGATFWISPYPGDIRGYNLQTNLNAQVRPDYEVNFAFALLGTAALLIGTVPTGGTDWVWGAGLMLGTIGTAYSWYGVATAAYDQYSNVTVQYYDSHSNGTSNWANATATTDPGVVDATFCNFVYWYLDNGSLNYGASHVLTITANLTYAEVNIGSGLVDHYNSCLTSVVLSTGPDGNDNCRTAQIISNGTTYSNLMIGGGYDTEDCFNISLDQGDRIYVIAQAFTTYPNDSEPCLSIFLNDSRGQNKNSTAPWHSEALSYNADSVGNWTIEIRGEAVTWGWYNLTATVDEPPDVPTLSGPSVGYAGASYTFYANTTDPENNKVTYTFDWGEGSNFTTGQYASGANASASHAWSVGVSQGYQVKVGAHDTLGAWSGWSPNQTVTMRNPALTINPVSGSGQTNLTSGTYFYPYGTSVGVLATPSVNWSFSCWNLDGAVQYGPNPIRINMNGDHYLTAYFYYTPPGGGGGGCPYVSTWNGTCYVLDNNVLPDSETNGGNDSQDYYVLQQTLVPTFTGKTASLYSLKLSEFEHEHDRIDQAVLLAVDHAAGVNVAVTPMGEILTYGQPATPTSAMSNDGFDVLSLLSASDGDYYQGYNCSYLTLTFAATDVSAGAKLVIRSEDPYLKCPIYVQTLNATGQWNTVAAFHTRSSWATDIINVTGYLPDSQGDFKVRLCFVSDDKIDYVGLDTTPQASMQLHTANLLNALSSSQGIVTRLLNADDEKYAKLLPGQQIVLTFQLPNSQNSERTFILCTEGHYETIH